MLPPFLRFERGNFLAVAGLLAFLAALIINHEIVDVIALGVMLGVLVMQAKQYRQDQVTQHALRQQVDTLAKLQETNQELVTKLEQSRQMSASLAKINTFAQGTIFNLDPPQVMRAACEVVLQIAQADRAAVFYRDEGQVESLGFVYGLRLTTEHQAWLEANHAQRPEAVNTIMTITDTHLSSEPTLLHESRIGRFRSKAEVLMRSGNTLTGMLIIYYNTPHDYQNAELELLETFAYQITAGLDNAELVKTLEAYAAEQAQLVLLSRTSTETLDLHEVIKSVSELLRHMVDSEHVYIGLLHDDHNLMRFYRVKSETLPIGDIGDTVELPQNELPEIEQLLNLGSVSPPKLLDLEQVSNGLKHLMAIQRDSSVVIAPLIAGGERLGAVVVGTPHRFGEQESRLLELAANQVALQVHNALQYQQVQNALERRLQQLALIEDIARQISSALNVDQLIGNVLDAAIKATQADMAVLAMMTEGGDFQIVGQEVENGVWYSHRMVRTSQVGVIGRVAKMRQPMIIQDNRQAPEYIATLSQGRYLSSLVVPLMRDETVLAVLNLESRQQGFFREEHAEFIKSLADHAVISIQNARLLQERQKQIDTLTNLRKLSLKLSSDTDRKSVVNAILQTAMTAFGAAGAVMVQIINETNTLSVLGSLRSTGHGVEQARLLIPDMIIREAQANGNIQITKNITADPRYAEFIRQHAIHYNSVVTAPIKRSQEYGEVLCLVFGQENPLIEHDLNTLELLLIQAGGHLQNTVLYERVSMVNERIRLFLDSSSDGIVLLDVAGNIVQANLSAERLLGVELTDNIGENFVDLLIQSFENEDAPPDAREGFRDTVRILRLEPERIIRRQFELRRRGQPIYISEVSSPVLDHQHQMIGRLLVLRDVTEEKLLADYRDEISHMLVHDLRSPLSAVYSGIAYVYEILAEPSMSGESGEFSIQEAALPVLDVAINSANNLLRLVDSLLDIAKLEKRSMPLTMSRARLQVMMDETLSMMDSLYKEADLTLEVRMPADLPDVYVDESKIKRVLLNLLDNAQRYSPQGGSVLVDAKIVDQKRKVLVRVNDSGQGIPVEERERVFEKFRQISGITPQRGRKGSGLGLTFCKLVIEAHGERIWIENEQESPLPGASFVFTIPVYAGHPEKDS